MCCLDVSLFCVTGEVALSEPVVQITAGGVHSAALAESGHVFLWEDFRDFNGQMGLIYRQILESLRLLR